MKTLAFKVIVVAAIVVLAEGLFFVACHSSRRHSRMPLQKRDAVSASSYQLNRTVTCANLE
jgi:hypothetical protein